MKVLQQTLIRSNWSRRFLNAVLMCVLILGSITPANVLAQPDASLVTNGDFSSGDAGWTITGSVSIAGDAAVYSGGEAPINGIIWQQISTISGRYYRLNYNVKRIGPGAGTPQIFAEVIDKDTNNVLTSKLSPGDAAGNLTSYTLSFLAQGASIIRFTDQSTTTADLDVFLDDVSVDTSTAGCTPQPANLVSWWPGNNYAFDIIGSNHGSLQNGAGYEAGNVGQAFSFNGSDQYVSIPSAANLEMRNNLTVMTWFKVNSLAPGSNAKIFSKRTNLFGPYEINVFNTGTIYRVQIMLSSDGSNWQYISSTQPITPGTWVHAAIVVDSSNLVTYYLNGQMQGTYQFSSPLMDHTGAAFLLGKDKGGSFILNGAVDETQIYNRALSGAEIQRVFNAGSIGVCTLPNTAPIATGESYNTPYQTALTITAPGLLANDTDVDGNPLSAVKISDPTHGSLTLNADGSFVYTPNTGYAGSDSFTYNVDDGVATSNTVTVNITVDLPEGYSGLLGYWKFDDGTGTTAKDSSFSAPSNTGSLAGGAAFSASAAPTTTFTSSGSLSVSGATASVVTVPNSAINKLTNSFTVSAWINPSSVSGYQRVIGSARTKSANGWSFGIFNSQLLFTTNGKKDYYSPTSTGMVAGKWYHIAAIMDSSNAVTFYLDGLAIGTVTGTSAAVPDTDDNLQIGAITVSGSSTLSEAFNGLIDDLRVYNRILDSTELANVVGIAPCSDTMLRARIMLGEANTNKTITLDGACTYTLTAPDSTWNGGTGLYLSYATTIEGNGATIERSAAPGTPMFRILTTGQPITIRNLTLRNGNVYASGAGLYSWGNLTLNNVRFVNNTSPNTPGSAYVNTAGALYSTANLTADRTLFFGNQTGGFGGAIYHVGTNARITNSVFADNLSGSSGSSIYTKTTTGTLTLLNNTFTNQYKPEKEGVLVNGPAAIQNNIFDNYANSLAASGTTAVVTEDYNLFTAVDSQTKPVNGGSFINGGHDRIAASPRFVDPSARNYQLTANSSAIDLGSNAGVSTDAANNPRPYTGTAVDIGAFEYQGVGVPSISITKSGPPYVSTGSQFRFSITVINESNNTLNDLKITDTLPTGASYIANSATEGGVNNSGVMTWTLAPLAPNQKRLVEYKVTATQDLVHNNYSVSSISTPAISATGSVFTTPYNTNARASGFFSYPDGFGFENYGDVVESSDISVEDMVRIYGTGVCKTLNPCVLTASAEAVRKTKATSSTGGHCAGMAAASMAIFDKTDVNPNNLQADARLTTDISKLNARGLIAYYMSTQGDNPANTTGLPAARNISGAKAIVDALKINYADPNPSDRYLLSLYDINGAGGHRVTPFAVVQQADPDMYWIYVYDNNSPFNFDRVFKVKYSTGAWVYEGGATSPTAPPSSYQDDGSHLDRLILRSFRWADAFPKKCTTACAPDPVADINGQTENQLSYDFQLEGEGSLMITRSDGKRAGVDPLTGQFISEIPGAEQTSNEGGMGMNVPSTIHVPHTVGMSYTLRVSDTKTAYGNGSSKADVNIFGDGFVTRLKGLKLDSSEDPIAAPGSNDVVGIVFDGDSHRVSYQSSSLDNDTPSLGMAISQKNAPDFAFEIGGAQMAPGKTLEVGFDTTTGKLSIENNDTSSNTFTLNLEKTNLDGSKNTYQSTSVGGGSNTGLTVDMGPSWTGGAPQVVPTNGALLGKEAYNTPVNTTLTISAPGVLRNDISASGKSLTAILVNGPQMGRLTLDPSGAFVYTPNTGYVGPDSFSYKANDGLTDSATITVNIMVTFPKIYFFPMISK
jgi:uncharacterized repeat protein (TIGR01451 family)